MDSNLPNSYEYFCVDLFAILDIEATGGNAKIGKITEIAIYKHDGKKVIDHYSSLVNPERSIPPYVQRLTGINNDMAKQAPTFEQVLAEIESITKSCVLVAHNVKVDYSFLKAEFENHQFSFQRERLCTLQLSRELIPGMDSYNLGKLCKSLNIPLEGHHRADNDAKATVQLFEKLLGIDKPKVMNAKRKI